MAGSLNKVMLIGHLGSDPDIRSMRAGGRVCNLSIATSESWKNKNTGERQTKTEWHRVTIYNEGLVNVCDNYLRKGAKVYIEGQLETRKWQDQNGQDRYTTEIILKAYNGTLTMLDSRGQDNQQSNAPTQSNQRSSQTPSAQTAQVPDDFEDDIPF